MRKIQSHDLGGATSVRKVRNEVDSDVPRGCDWLILMLLISLSSIAARTS